MKRSSSSIKLVLIGTALFAAGCGGSGDRRLPAEQLPGGHGGSAQTTGTQTRHTYYRPWYHPFIFWGGSGTSYDNTIRTGSSGSSTFAPVGASSAVGGGRSGRRGERTSRRTERIPWIRVHGRVQHGGRNCQFFRFLKPFIVGQPRRVRVDRPFSGGEFLMKRVACEPRPDWRTKVESQGMLFHTADDDAYWDESAYYEFTSREIDELEKATYDLNEMCLKAVDHVIEKDLFARFLIPPEFVPFLKNSWQYDERTIYGRFDLAYDGATPPKLLEYNADTPTGLLEAAVIQWTWLQDQKELTHRTWDQFNSIHERLIEAWQTFSGKGTSLVYFTCDADSLEDYITTNYLRDTAMQAGLETEFIAIGDVGWDPGPKQFVDLNDKPISCVFKLYPWEWMFAESFGRNLLEAGAMWLEPPWKAILSSKALLPVLHELFPDSPYVLPASFEPTGDTYAAKPIHAREGANITLMCAGVTVQETGGPLRWHPVRVPGIPPPPQLRRQLPGGRKLDGQRLRLRHGDSRGQGTGHHEPEPVRAAFVWCVRGKRPGAVLGVQTMMIGPYVLPDFPSSYLVGC